MDRLSNLLSRFGVRANLFYDGDHAALHLTMAPSGEVISICFRPLSLIHI